MRLTELTSCGGCAAKYAAPDLKLLLQDLVARTQWPDNLLVGLQSPDDAAVYRLDDERALVVTLDFFPPLVDDPTDFGAIAAANALNDIFAMGSEPLVALSIAAFPEDLPREIVRQIIAAAEEQVRAAGAILAGGHTLRDREPKYGLAVVGTVHPERLWTKTSARSGDALFITKPLGTGLVLHGWRRRLIDDAALATAVRWMRTLNSDAARILRRFGPHAVTDVTGFGLFGHAWEVAEGSGVRLELKAGSIPALPGAIEVARVGQWTGADSSNRDYAGPHLTVRSASRSLVTLGYDPQTAGGLLFALPSQECEEVETAFRTRRLFLQRIGTVRDGEGVALV